jgi:hypothetical protein
MDQVLAVCYCMKELKAKNTNCILVACTATNMWDHYWSTRTYILYLNRSPPTN